MKRVFLLTYLIGHSFFPAGAEAFRGLTFEVRMPSQAAYEGPAYFCFVFHYKGLGKAELPSEVYDQFYDSAAGCVNRYHNRYMYDGPAYPFVLRDGDSAVIRHNLHEEFIRLDAGPEKIPFHLTVDPRINGTVWKWKITDTLKCTIAPPDTAAAMNFVAGQLEKIKSEQNWSKREELYNEIFFLHADISAVLDACHVFLADSMIGHSYNYWCRYRFADLSIKYGRMDDLFRFLLYRGGINDEVIFERMLAARKMFSDREAMLLMDISSDWVRYYMIRHCLDLDDHMKEVRRQRIISLKDNLKWLNDRVDELK